MARTRIAELLKAITTTYDKTFTQMMLNQSDLPSVTSTQMTVLQYMAQHEDEVINQRQLQAVLNLSKSTVSGIVQRLRDRGFIEVKPDRDDKRANRIEFSASFRKQMQIHEADYQKQIDLLGERLVAGMSQEEIAQYQHLLAQSLSNLTDDKKA